jgi:hypothetical protein
MDMLLNKSNRAQQQAHYLALAAKYRERAERSADTVAAGYLSLANGYEVLAQTFGKLNHLSDRSEEAPQE